MGAQIMTNTLAKHTVSRREFVANLIKEIPDALIVTGLGSPSYDVFAAGDRDENFYLWGAMGGSTSLGLGLALAQPEKKVVVITGDGEQLMGIGSLMTIGVQAPKNLSIVVLDNGHFGETGMQRSHASLGADLVGLAKASGIPDAHLITSDEGYAEIAKRINQKSATNFNQVLITADEPPRALPSRDGVYVKNRFRATLGLHPF
jgi:phosphonopyruvate decarboxylase